MSGLSANMKEYLQAFLQINPKDRIRANEALRNPLMLKKNTQKGVNNEIIERFRRFRVLISLIISFNLHLHIKIKNRIHQLLLMFIIDRIMSPAEKLYFESSFEVFDTNLDGVLSKPEMLASKKISSLSPSQVFQRIFEDEERSSCGSERNERSI